MVVFMVMFLAVSIWIVVDQREKGKECESAQASDAVFEDTFNSL